MRTFAEIVNEIDTIWGAKIYFGAVLYIEALSTIHSTDKNAKYMLDTAETLVLYLLSNMGTFRGEDARRIKAELKSIIK